MRQDKPTPAQMQDWSGSAQQMEQVAFPQSQLPLAPQHIAHRQSNMGAPETYAAWFYKHWRPPICF